MRPFLMLRHEASGRPQRLRPVLEPYGGGAVPDLRGALAGDRRTVALRGPIGSGRCGRHLRGLAMMFRGKEFLRHYSAEVGDLFAAGRDGRAADAWVGGWTRGLPWPSHRETAARAPPVEADALTGKARTPQGPARARDAARTSQSDGWTRPDTARPASSAGGVRLALPRGRVSRSTPPRSGCA